MQCERCGRNVPLRSKVCPNCGKDNPNYEPRPETVPERPVVQQVRTGGATVQQTRPSGTTAQQTKPSGTTASSQTTKAPAQAQVASSTEKKTDPPKKSTLKTIIILALVVFAVIFVMKRCNAYQLRGTWEASDGSTITFSDSKNGYITAGRQNVNFTYFVDGDEVEIKTTATPYINSKVVRYKFDISGNKLTLTDVDYGITEVFYKK